MRRIALLLGVVIGLVGCEGPAGPQGPTGPEGPAGQQGPQGPPGNGGGGRMTILAQADTTGVAMVQFPASVSSPVDEPPALHCYYTSEETAGTWFPMNDGFWEEDSPWCALLYAGNDRWAAAGMNLDPAWIAAFVVIF